MEGMGMGRWVRQNEKTKFSGRKTNLCPNQKNPASGGIFLFYIACANNFPDECPSLTTVWNTPYSFICFQ